MIDWWDIADKAAGLISKNRPAILEWRISKLWRRIKKQGRKRRTDARLRRIRRMTIRVQDLEDELVELKRIRGMQ